MAGTLPSSRIWIRFGILPYSFVPTFSGLHQFFSHPLPRIARAFFYTKSRGLPACLFSYFIVAFQMSLSPFPQKIDRYFWPSAFSLHLHVLTASPTSHTSILVGLSTPLRSMLRSLPLLFHENPFFLWLWLEVFTIFPFLDQAVKAGCMLQSCMHFSSLSLSLAALSLSSLPP